MGSCNGCRVLRKGCNQNCTIRPCLQWIQRSDAQSNATMFLAKFYGRAGLTNLLDSGPEPFRPALFRSLLYEACGRIVNPVYGSVGLMCTGQWQLCEAAVQSVLNGIPIFAMPSPRAYGIRHVLKSKELAGPSTQLHSVKKNGAAPFKRSGHQAAGSVANSTVETEEIVSQDEFEEVDGGLGLDLSLSLAPLGTGSRARGHARARAG